MQPKQTDPLWAETRFLYLRHPGGKEPLRVRLLHRDVAEEDHRIMGEALIPDVQGLMDGEVHELQIDLVSG